MPNEVFWAALGGGLAGGLATGGIALLVEWVRRHWDRPRLVVRAYRGYLLGEADQLVFCEAINPSVRPVSVNSFGLGFAHKSMGDLYISPQLGCQFPYEIGGGKSLSQWTALDGLVRTLKQEGRTPSDLKWVYFRTQSGKTFRGRLDKAFLRIVQVDFDKQHVGRVS